MLYLFHEQLNLLTVLSEQPVLPTATATLKTTMIFEDHCIIFSSHCKYM